MNFFIIFAHCRLYAEDVQTRTAAATGVPEYKVRCFRHGCMPGQQRERRRFRTEEMMRINFLFMKQSNVHQTRICNID